MTVFRKLKRVWSHNDMNHIPGFRETFPELKNLSSEELCDRFVELGIEFYTKEETPVNPFIRLTLPLAVITWIIMFMALPVAYIFTGRWGYSFSKNNIICNWFSMLFK